MSHADLAQSFRFLLKRYQKSITHQLSYNDPRLTYTNNDQLTILSSRMPPRNDPVTTHTFAWYSELRSRSVIIDFLVKHEITQMLDYTNDWPTLDVPKAELEQRLTIFKRRALLLLYRLVSDIVPLLLGYYVSSIG